MTIITIIIVIVIVVVVVGGGGGGCGGERVTLMGMRMVSSIVSSSIVSDSSSVGVRVQRGFMSWIEVELIEQE